MAPRLASLVEFRGDPATGRFVEHLTLRGLTLSDAALGARPARVDGRARRRARSRARSIATGARHVAIEGCMLKNLAGYAIDLRDGCRGVRLVGNELAWIGAGGIKVNGAVDPEPLRTGETVITDNRIHHLGRLFHSGVGVLMMNSLRQHRGAQRDRRPLLHRRLRRLGLGLWAERQPRQPVEFNHIHHVGQGLLSDMGAVYTLGLSPGTVVRNNVIHDVAGHDKGWGLYTDEGSTGIVLENNLVYRTTHGGFHQHYGRDNVVREQHLRVRARRADRPLRDEPHRSFTFERNIVYYRTGELLSYVWSGGTDRITLDHNLYWNPAGAAEIPRGQPRGLAGTRLRHALDRRRSALRGPGP